MAYFHLAQELLRDYFAPAEINVVFSSEKHLQWAAAGYTVVVTETSPTSTVLILLHGNDAAAIPINWAEWDLAETKRTDELQRRFDQLLNLKLKPTTAPTRPNENRATPSRQPESRTLPQLANQDLRLPHTYPATETRRPADMPEFDDEYEINPREPPSVRPGFSVGDRDLTPAGVGQYPEMRPYIDPLADGPRGGMYVGPNDPMFGQRGGNTSRRGVPPGARFDDPYGEDNLQDMGMGLPGNLRGPGGPGGFGPGSGFGGPGPGFGGTGSGFGGSGLGGPGFF